MGHQPLAAGLPLASARLSDAVCPSSDASQPEQQEASPSGRVAVGDWQTWKLLLAGGVSGAVSKTATAPLARMTILYQVATNREGPLQALDDLASPPPPRLLHGSLSLWGRSSAKSSAAISNEAPTWWG